MQVLYTPFVRGSSVPHNHCGNDTAAEAFKDPCFVTGVKEVEISESYKLLTVFRYSGQ